MKQAPAASTTSHGNPRRRTFRVPVPAARRGGRSPVRQSRHDRASHHARPERGAGHGLRARFAGRDRGGDGGRLRPCERPSRRLQRTRGAGARKRDGLALQREVLGVAGADHGRATGDRPRTHRTPPLRSARPDRRAARQMGGGGPPARGLAPHRAPGGQGRPHPPDRAGLHLAPRRYPQSGGGPGARRPHPGGRRRPPGGRGPRPPRRTAAPGGTPGDRERARDRDERRVRRGGPARRGTGRPGIPADRTLRRALPLRAPRLSRRP